MCMCVCGVCGLAGWRGGQGVGGGRPCGGGGTCRGVLSHGVSSAGRHRAPARRNGGACGDGKQPHSVRTGGPTGLPLPVRRQCTPTNPAACFPRCPLPRTSPACTHPPSHCLVVHPPLPPQNAARGPRLPPPLPTPNQPSEALHPSYTFAPAPALPPERDLGGRQQRHVPANGAPPAQGRGGSQGSQGGGQGGRPGAGAGFRPCGIAGCAGGRAHAAGAFPRTVDPDSLEQAGRQQDGRVPPCAVCTYPTTITIMLINGLKPLCLCSLPVMPAGPHPPRPGRWRWQHGLPGQRGGAAGCALRGHMRRLLGAARRAAAGGDAHTHTHMQAQLAGGGGSSSCALGREGGGALEVRTHGQPFKLRVLPQQVGPTGQCCCEGAGPGYRASSSLPFTRLVAAGR